jgi:hypothetical protein
MMSNLILGQQPNKEKSLLGNASVDLDDLAR